MTARQVQLTRVVSGCLVFRCDVRTAWGLLEPDIERLEIFGNTDELGHVAGTYLLRRLGVLPLEEEARHFDLRAEQRVRSRRGRLTYAS